jgi:hypothetical protein
MAEVAARATKAVPGAAGRVPAARHAAERAGVARRVFSEPGEAAERSAGARSMRALIGAGPAAARVRSIPAVPESVHSVLNSPGAPLSGRDRTAMEAYFGHDFAQVRIHDDALAAQSAADVHADAYSFGNDIVLGAGIKPQGSQRRHSVLAHELTHVLQQPPAERPPLGFAKAEAVAENEARASAAAFKHGLSPRWCAGAATAGLIHRQPKDAAPQPAAQEPAGSASPKAAAAPQKQDQPAPEPAADLSTRVREWLNQQNFGLPLVADSPHTSGAHRVFYERNISTLDAVADDVTDVLGQTMPGVFRKGQRTDLWTDLRVEVWKQVWQYYNEKKEVAENDRWQTVIQVLYTPQLTFYAKPPGAVPSTQHNIQVGFAKNLRLHRAGGSGLELQPGATVSLFNLGSGKADAFQNALLTIQAQVVANLGPEFRIAPDTWANVQGSIFAQLSAGVGGSYADTAGGGRSLYIGFLAQPSAGAQVNLNIGWFQVIAQGSVVYSYLSQTTQQGSTSTRSAAAQFGLGVGAQF